MSHLWKKRDWTPPDMHTYTDSTSVQDNDSLVLNQNTKDR